MAEGTRRAQGWEQGNAANIHVPSPGWGWNPPLRTHQGVLLPRGSSVPAGSRSSRRSHAHGIGAEVGIVHGERRWAMPPAPRGQGCPPRAARPGPIFCVRVIILAAPESSSSIKQ